MLIQFSLPRSLRFVVSNRKVVLSIVAVVSLAATIWLSLRLVQSAPPAVMSAPPPVVSPAQPFVTLDVPAEVLIGEQFKFRVTFKNSGPLVGYGPFVDLVLDSGGANITKPPQSPACACDGVTFISAQVVDVNNGPLPLPAVPITTACASSPNPVVVHHLFENSGVLPVSIPAGAQLITLALPFGSFEPTQPEIVIEVTAKVSPLADADYSLGVSARGGFQFGSVDALDDPGLPDPPLFSDENPPGTQVTNSASWAAQDSTKPTVMIIKKTYLGPENETATGPNFPRRYLLTLDIADTQTVSNVVLMDCLPNNMAYGHLVLITPTQSSLVEPQPDVANNTPASCLTVSWTSLTGVPGVDGTVEFEFFIPELDADFKSILEKDCAVKFSNNDIKAEGLWTPTDISCDTQSQIVSDQTPIDHILADKCIAIQKSVATYTETGAAGFTPDDILQYELNFQISDFKTFGDLEVTDLLSDGQSLTGPAPTLFVEDKYGPVSGAFNSSDLITTTTNVVPTPKCQNVTGATSLTFKVSQKMISLLPPFPRHAAGILTGGLATTPAVPASKGATGKIVFFAKIDDKFKNTLLLDPPVDKEDPLTNCVEVKGNSLENVDPPALPAIVEHDASDDSNKAIAIVGDILRKSVYAVRRGGAFVCGPVSDFPSGPVCSNLSNQPQEVRPGDDVTFRIGKTIPSTDAETLTIEDWLPLPIFNVAGMSFQNVLCGIPAANVSCLGPDDELNQIVAPGRPLFIANPPPGANSIVFNYGTFDHIDNHPRRIDLLFTSTVRNDPFADKLFLTNEVLECERNSFAGEFCQVAIAQVNLREPNLHIRKGVVASDNLNAVFEPAPPAPAGVTFDLGGFVSGPITSSNVGLINSNISNVDANDVVTFAVTIENAGGHPAFDFSLEDIVPHDISNNLTCFKIDFSSIRVTLGSGASVANSITQTASGGFTLNVPGSITELNPTTTLSGDNIIVVTFQAKVNADITPGCCFNQARITHYASIAQGPDFVAANFNGPYDDSARVCAEPTLIKSVVATSELHTTPQTSATGTPQVTIGEIVRYRLEVRLPEGSAPNLAITDFLPPGLSFVDPAAARAAFVSNGGITHVGLFGPSFDLPGNAAPASATLDLMPPIPPGAITGGAGCGAPVIFSLGNVQNNDNDPDLEFVVIEFNALVCNLGGNQNGTTLANTFRVSVNNSTIADSPPVNVAVVEPNLTITKAVSPTTLVQGVTATYTVTITNTSPVKAFDTQFSDTLPAGLILDPSSVSFGGSCSSPVLVNTVPSLTCAEIPASGVVTLTYKALARPDTCPVTLTNNARTTWTSLPGPKGTTSNSTMSSTPGNPGATEGERDGSSSPALNDYLASASAPLRVICPPCTTAPPNMVAWWPFDEPNGATVDNDIAAFNNQGHPTPGISLGAVNAPGSVTGLVGLAVNIPAKTGLTGPHIEVPDHAELNFGLGDLSVDSWVFVPQALPPAAHTYPIVDKLQTGPASAQFLGYALSLVTSGSGSRLVFVMGDGTAFGSYSDPANVVPFGQWTHIAVTVKRSTKTVTFYVNGISVATIDPAMPTGSLTNTLPLFIGEIRAKNSQAAINIDELEMFDRAISSGEVQNIFKAFSGGKCKCPTIVFSPAGGPLPSGVVNIPYTQTFTATGGCSSSFTYNVVSGALPPGLTLSSSGVLSGTPKQPGVYTFTITATDKCGCSRSQTYTLTVDCPTVPLPLFNTGLSDDRSLLASGAKDPHYELQSGSPLFPDATVIPTSQIPGSWLPNTSTSQWIGPDITPLGNSPGGLSTFYTYRTTFTFPAGADLSTAIISGQWTSDNDSEIFLNGVSTGFTIGTNAFGAFKPFVITGVFLPGVPNTIDFRVRNLGAQTGLRVEMNGSVRCCPPPKADKCVVTTSESHTIPANSTGGTPQVAIGEIIRYRLTATLTEGVSPSFRFTDHLPPGLTYLGNPAVAFVSTGGTGSISSSVSGLSGLVPNLTAANVGACSGPTPTFQLPAGQVTGGPFSSGTDPTFNLGNLTNTHSDPNLEYVILEFNALVNNLPVNAPGPPNQSGATLSNSYDVFVGNGTTPIATSTPTDVVIVEPHVVVQKTVTTNPLTNQPTFTVTLTNTGAATAFDVEVNDALPAGLSFAGPSPTFNVSPAGCSQPNVNVSGNALTMTIPVMPVGCTVTLTFTVAVSATCIPEPNIAHVSYTSLPGGSNSTPVGTQPNNTGSVTPGPTGADNGDRIYTASAQASINVSGGVGGPCAPSCKCPLKISRFRENGPNGTGDEFVEIFNPGDFDVTVSECSNDPAGKSNGIGVFASAGNGFNPQFGQTANVAQLVCQIPGATVIPSRGYFLCGGTKYSLNGLGNNGGTSHSVPDQIIGTGNASTGIKDIPNDAGLALLDIGSNTATQCTIGALGCCSGFNYSSFLGTGGAVVYDKVGFAAYGPGSPLNVGPGYPANIYPSLASQYCEGTCLQPVGDASVRLKGPGVPCAPVSPAPGIVFPSQPGGTIGATSICYGESGQYEILRRQTLVALNVGTLHRDTENNPDDFILVAPNPATNTVGQTITGKGVTSVLGAAGPYNLSAPHDISSNSFTKSTILPFVILTAPDPDVANIENAPLKTLTIRLSYTNNSGHVISGVRFKVDDLTTLCGTQSLISNSASSIFGTGDARNLLASPNCGPLMGNIAILKAVNSQSTPGVLTNLDGVQTFLGTVLEDLSVGPPVGALSPFGGGVDSSFVVIDSTAPNPIGDGVTGGKGTFTLSPPIPPGGKLFVQFKFGVVKGGSFQFILTPMGR